MNIKEQKKNLSKINLIILPLFFGLLFLPNNVLASNCCEISTITVGINGFPSNPVNSCKDDADVNKETCVNKTISNANSNANQTAVFFENSACNKETNKCVVGSAAATTEKKVELRPINFKFNIPLPGLPQSFIVDSIKTDGIDNYIAWLYRFVVGIAGLLAVFMITVGGLIWIFAGGNGSKISKAREYITGAVIGLLLAIFSYSILYIINPQLVLNKFPALNPVDVAGIDGFTGNPESIGRKGNDCFYKEFGASPEEVSKGLEIVDCPFLRPDIGKLQVHKKVANAFRQACSKVPKGTKTVCGTTPIMSQSYMWRDMASGGRSLHSFGVALDISLQDCTVAAKWFPDLIKKGIYKEGTLQRDFFKGDKKNGIPSSKGQSNLPPEIINAFKSSGFVWGGDWPESNPTDNMHFETYGPCTIKSQTRGSGTGGSGGQCSGSIMSITSGKPTSPQSLKSEWTKKMFGKEAHYYQLRNGSSQHDSVLVIYFHGMLTGLGGYINGNCDVVQKEIDEVTNSGEEKYGLACIYGNGNLAPNSPWTGIDMPAKITNAINKFKSETGSYPGKVFVAGHSNAYYAMNELIGSSVDSKINKYIWLDACYDNPKGSSKVIGIEVTTTLKTNAPCKCSSIENRYDKPGVGHFDAIKYLSDYLKKL